MFMFYLELLNMWEMTLIYVHIMCIPLYCIDKLQFLSLHLRCIQSYCRHKSYNMRPLLSRISQVHLATQFIYPKHSFTT